MTETEATPVTSIPPILRRFTEMAEKFERSGPETPQISPQSTVDTISELVRCGYPKRHSRRDTGEITGNCERLVETFKARVLAGDCMIILAGIRGSGKTQAAVELARARSEAGMAPGIYRKAFDIFADIKRSWDKKTQEDSEHTIMRKLRTTRFLVIDEFHETGASEWEARTLINLLDHRYDDQLATLIIANFSREELPKNLNPSIIDRANETGGLVFCDWASYRK